MFHIKKLLKMKMKIIFIIAMIVLIYFVQNKKILSSFSPDSTCPIVKKLSPFTLTDIIKDINIRPIGCFTNIKDLYFKSCINPYSKDKKEDSGIRITNYPEDIINLINIVIQNGYDLYGNEIKNIYKGSDYSNLNIKQLSSLGYLSGYRYISIYKNDINEHKNIFFSYGPPQPDRDTDFKSDLPDYQLTPKFNNYTNENENESGKELSCGYPCLKDKQPEIFVENGIKKQYMCGSITYPTIKTPPRYAVYEIYEKK